MRRNLFSFFGFDGLHSTGSTQLCLKFHDISKLSKFSIRVHAHAKPCLHEKACWETCRRHYKNSGAWTLESESCAHPRSAPTKQLPLRAAKHTSTSQKFQKKSQRRRDTPNRPQRTAADKQIGLDTRAATATFCSTILIGMDMQYAPLPIRCKFNQI